jgi:phage/plasmid-associated DNA primase
LEGLQQYLADGLGEPAEIEALAIEQRNESDSVARFLQDRISDGLVQVGVDLEVSAEDLHGQYMKWAGQVGERGLGNRRFGHRLMSVFPTVQRKSGVGRAVWTGIAYRTTGSWMLTPPNFFQPD